MAPLELEVYRKGEWVQGGSIRPGEPMGSIAYKRPDGSRGLYVFACSPDDSKSAIYDYGQAGPEIDLGKFRVVKEDSIENFLRQLEVLKTLKRGDDPYIMTVEIPEPGQGSIRVRFTHK